MTQLGTPPQAAGADNAAGSQLVKSSAVAGYEHIDRIFAFRDRADAQPLRYFCGHILHAVYCNIDPAGDQCLFDFFNKKALAAHFGERHIQNFVSLGLYNDKFNRGRRKFFHQG